MVKNNHKNFINSFIPLLFAEENQEKYSKEIGELQKIASNISAEAVIAALAGMRDRESRTNFLSNFKEPVFFIIGKQDSRIQFNEIIAQLSLPKNCEALVLDGVGHMGFIEEQEITLLALEHFAERVFYLHTIIKK